MVAAPGRGTNKQNKQWNLRDISAVEKARRRMRCVGGDIVFKEES